MQRFRSLNVQIEQKILRKGVFLLAYCFHLVSICISTTSFLKKLIAVLQDSTLPSEVQHGLILNFPGGKLRFRAQELYLLTLTLSFPPRPWKRTQEVLTSQPLRVSRPHTGPYFTAEKIQKCPRTHWNTLTNPCVSPDDQVLDAFSCTDTLHFHHSGKTPKGMLLLPFCRAQVMLWVQY